jgi:nitrite reductase/ring-hydroxylating ferredoxin subunit
MNELTNRLRQAIEKIEGTAALDAPASAIEPLVAKLTSSATVKSLLSGTPTGHRLHPVLTDIPIGCWTSASTLDLVAPRSGAIAARRLTGLGIVSAIPTVASGLSDWKDTYGGTKRVGVVHMAANTTGILFEIASWSARRRGHFVRGALLGLAGLSALTVGGYLGGHLVFARRAGVDVEVPVVDDERWHEACAFDELLDGEPVGVTVDDARVVLVRRFRTVAALAAVCNHAGGPLDAGEVRDGSIVCPWHGSCFRLEDGSVARGPATSPQPTYETRVRGNLVEIRRHRPDAIRSAPDEDLRDVVES